MKILYDLLASQAQAASLYHGGSEYGKAIFMELLKSIVVNKDSNKGLEITVFYNGDMDLDELVIEIIEKNSIAVIDIKNAKELEKHLFEQSYDLLFSALPQSYRNIKIPKSCIFVGVIHDTRSLELIYDKTYSSYLPKLSLKSIKHHLFAHSLKLPFLHPLLFRLKDGRGKKVYEEVARVLDVILTVSEHSKHSMLYYLDNVQDKDIRVYYTPQKYIALTNTMDNHTGNIGNVSDKYGEECNKYGDYVLLVSVNRFEKNPINAIKALEGLYSKDLLETKCVTVGNLSQKIRKKIKYPEKFVHLGYVSREELECLYKNAQLFIYPSFSEGFGMPPLEALKYGTKVVGSAVTAIPEICGDSIFYFNPYNVDEMAVRIYQAINSGKLDNSYFLETSIRQKEDLQSLVRDIKKGFGKKK